MSEETKKGDSERRIAGEMPATVPERALRRPAARADVTIAVPSREAIPSNATHIDSVAPSMMLDSYQPAPLGTQIASGPPAPPDPSQREVIVPSTATVASILDQVRKRPAERFDIEARVASGGMGSIDVAVDRALDRRIAVKTLHPHLRPDEATVRMFLREARLTGLLDHPHIVPVYDLGEREGGQLFFSMKLVEGQTLAALIRSLPSKGVLETATLYMLLDLIVKVCDALAFAHSRGVLHCDVKPANVMVGEFGQVFLMDWGIARLIATDAAPGSARGPVKAETLKQREPRHGPATDNSIIGTPCYMSPEQARGDRKKLDVRSDVFLLGALLYEVLTHRPPYPSNDRVETLALAAAGVFPTPRRVAGDVAVPQELDRIVMRAMAKNPNDRYPSVAALREDVVRFMQGGANFPRKSFDAGDVIVQEGERGDAAYILVEGSCEVSKDMPTGGPQTIKTIGPGDVFGEMAILTEGPRTATVTAIAPTTVLIITSRVLEEEMSALKPWMATLMKSLAARFRDIDTQVRATYAATPSPVRLANQVLMNLMTWGTPDDDSGKGRYLKWSAFAPELEAQLGLPPLALFSVIARYGLVLDVEADRLTAPDVDDFRKRIAESLGTAR